MNPPDWTETALRLMTAVYVVLPVPDRERLAAAVEAANRRLRDNPEIEGESRGGRYRVTFADRLTIWFRVRPGPTPVAVVVHVHWFGPMPDPDGSAG